MQTNIQENVTHAKVPKLALNQETVRNLTGSQKGKEFCISIPPSCHSLPPVCQAAAPGQGA